MNKQIKIAVDAGFSGGKIVINELVMNVPFAIFKKNHFTDGDYSLRRVDNDFIECRYENETYSIGQAAKDYLLRAQKSNTTNDTMQGFYTISRFDSKQFEIALKAMIAYALIKYADFCEQNHVSEKFTLEDINEWDICVGVSLPHSYLNEYKRTIKHYLVGEDSNNPITHSIAITVGTNSEIELNFVVNPRIVCNSQCMSAIINELIDQDGNDVEDICEKNNRPVLVIDGGYKTVGEACIERDMSVVGADSVTEYAMMSINTDVANQISLHTSGYYDYMIDEMALNQEQIRYLSDNNEVKTIEVADLQKKSITVAANNYIAHLLDKFDNLLSIKSILIAGGTGMIYYPYIKEYCDKNRSYLSDKIFVGTQNSNNKFVGIVEAEGKYKKEIIDNPIYTVVLGLYKEMCAKLS